MAIDATPIATSYHAATSGSAVEPASFVASSVAVIASIDSTVAGNLLIACTVFLKSTAMQAAVSESNPVPALNSICATLELAFLKM
ncbi:hypothetical protein II941_03995 [bacterium]|nr:hypothetical protein [bacterium]